MLGGLFVAVTLFLPKGIVGTLAQGLARARGAPPCGARREGHRAADRRRRPIAPAAPSACAHPGGAGGVDDAGAASHPQNALPPHLVLGPPHPYAAPRERWRERLSDDKRHGLLYLNNVTVSFDGFKALNGLSLVVDTGEMRAIIGPNGAGKTTMMDVITGKTRPDEGDVYLRGRRST